MTETGNISGVIRKAHDNDPLKDVIVNIFQGKIDTRVTGEDGSFTSGDLSPGIYFVQASLRRYETSPRLPVRVHKEQTTNIDISLTPLETAGRYFGDREQITVLSTDRSGQVSVRSQHGQFDELVTNEKTPQIEISGQYGFSNLRDFIVTENNGSVDNNGIEYELQTDVQINSRAVLQTIERGRYQPGNACECGIAARLPEMPAGSQEARWGYFDDNNGAFFGRDDVDLFICLRREGADTKIYRNNWNADPLDGTGPSGLELNLTKGYIFQILYTCYGYGVTNFKVLMEDEHNVQNVITVHRFKPNQQTTFGDPNLPIRGEVLNGEETNQSLTMFVAGRQYHVIGRYVPFRRITSERRFNVSLNETLIPAISFRRKEDFPVPDRSNSVSVKLQSFDIIADTDLLYEIRFAPELENANFGTPTNTSNKETAVESDTEANAFVENEGGELIFAGLAAGGTNGRPFAAGPQFATVELLDLDLSGLEPITLALRTVLGIGEASVVFRVREEW